MSSRQESFGKANAELTPRKLILIYDKGCSICAEQLPGWIDLLNRAPNDDVEVWLVSYLEQDPPATIMSVVNDRRIPYRILTVEGAVPFKIATGGEIRT